MDVGKRPLGLRFQPLLGPASVKDAVAERYNDVGVEAALAGPLARRPREIIAPVARVV